MQVPYVLVLLQGTVLFSLQFFLPSVTSLECTFGLIGLVLFFLTREPLRWNLLGVALMVASTAGPTTLLIATLPFLLSFRVCKRLIINPFLLFLFVWCLIRTVGEVDSRIWQSFVLGAPLPELPSSERWYLLGMATPLSLLAAWKEFLHALQFFALIAVLQEERDRQEYVAQGLFWGVVLALPCILMQLLSTWGPLFPNQNSFWNGIHRWSGTFSDPNAFGVMTALVLPTLLERSGNYQLRDRTILFLFTLLSFFSGSRSLLIGLLLLALFWIYRREVGKKRLIAWLVATFSVLGVLGIVLTTVSPDVFPRSLGRIAHLLQGGGGNEGFFSRMLFWKVGGLLWGEHLWMGVGLGRFRDELLPMVQSLGIDLQLWSDNANSFYLSLLSECGIWGAVLLFLSLRSWRFRADSCAWGSKGALGIALVLFLFGPHQEFSEVCLLLAFHCSRVFQEPQREDSSRWVGIQALGLGVVFFLVLFPYQRTFPFGFYSWERDGTTYFRWSTLSAADWISCKEDSASLRLRATSPTAQSYPVRIALRTPYEELFHIIRFPGDEWRVTISCSGRPRVRYALRVGRVWSPDVLLHNGDKRILGVQVIHHNGEETSS